MGTFANPGAARSTPALRVWRHGRGLLVHHGPQPSIGIDALLAVAGRSGYDAPSYLLVDAAGVVAESYSVTTWSVPGERGAAFHIVESGALLKVTVREALGSVPVVSTTTALAGLEEVPASDGAARSRAAAVIRSDVDRTALRLDPR
ncbi:MAG: hypothetical protein ABW221_23665 [Vicinamibacteria bacterium]